MLTLTSLRGAEEAYTLDEENPSVVRRVLYLQCGPLDANKKRFYESFEEWLDENKPIEEMVPLGPVIMT